MPTENSALKFVERLPFYVITALGLAIWFVFPNQVNAGLAEIAHLFGY